MNDPRQSAADEASLAAEAARWAVRRDRGLSSAEAIEFELWLAADPRHAAAMQRSGTAWSLLDRLPESVAAPELAGALRQCARWRRLAWSLPVAAALVLGAFWMMRAPGHAPGPEPAASMLLAAGPREVTLADGTLVRLNAGGEVREQFSAAERRVRLTRGEAHFTVTKDPQRPFLVLAGALQVRAIGTAFNVHLQAERIEVLVTEGEVGIAAESGRPLAAAPEPGAPAAEAPVALQAVSLRAGERARLSAAESGAGRPAPDIEVTRVAPAEIARALAWQESLLRLGGSTLAEIVEEFERRSGRRVVLADPALARLRVGGRFRADDLNGFAELLAAAFEVAVEREADGTLVLRKKNPETR